MLFLFCPRPLNPVALTDSTQTMKRGVEDSPRSRISDSVASDKLSTGVEGTSNDGALASRGALFRGEKQRMRAEALRCFVLDCAVEPGAD